MSECQCSECGVSVQHLGWGFALLAREGWALTLDAQRSAARSWLCTECAARLQRVTRSLGRIGSSHLRGTLEAPATRSSRPPMPSGVYRLRFVESVPPTALLGRTAGEIDDLPARVNERHKR